jgi:hypothetical protein
LEDEPPRTSRAGAHTQALAKLGLLDGLRLLVHPVALGSEGRKPIFEGYDMTEL